MAERDYGFIKFGSGHSSIIASATLADADNVSPFTLQGDDAATAVYAQGGIVLESLLQVRYTASADEKTQLLKGGHMRCDASTQWLADTYTAPTEEFLIGHSQAFGQKAGLEKSNASLLKYRDSPSGGFSDTTRNKSETRGDFQEVIISWYGTTMQVYIDKLPVTHLNGIAMNVDMLLHMTLGAIGNSAVSGAVNCPVKNFHISTQSINLHVPYGMSHICLMGHSFSEGMDYQATRGTPLGDRNQVDTGNASASAHLHEALHKKGWELPQGKIRNTGVGGTVLASVETGLATSNVANHLVSAGAEFLRLGAQVGMTITNTDSAATALCLEVADEDLTLDSDIFPLGNSTENFSYTSGYEGQIQSLVKNFCSAPDICILQMGTNDAASPISPTWDDEYQVHIDSLIAHGARIIIMINAITRNTNPVYSGEPYETRINEVNAFHDALVAANPECHLVNAFEIIGGHDNWLDSDVLQLSPTHLNTVGYTKILVNGGNGYPGVAGVLIPLISAQ